MTRREDDFTSTPDGAAAHSEWLGEPLIGQEPPVNVLPGRYTFGWYANLDPAIKALEALARRAAPAAGGDPDYRVFLLEIKPLVTALVGWHRGESRTRLSHAAAADHELSTDKAYDVVYQHLAAVIGGEA